MTHRITADFLRKRFARVMSAAGYDVTSPAYTRNAEGRNVATVGHTFLGKGAMGGWYAGQLMNEGGGERNLCGTWSTLDTKGMMAFLDGIECLNDRTARAKASADYTTRNNANTPAPSDLQGAIDRLEAWADAASANLRRCAVEDEPKFRNQAANYRAVIAMLKPV